MKSISISTAGWTYIGPAPLYCVAKNSTCQFMTSTTAPSVGATGVTVNSGGSYKSSDMGNVYAISNGDGSGTTVDFRALASSDFAYSLSGVNPLLACANRGQFPNATQVTTGTAPAIPATAASSNLMKVESRKACTIGGAAVSEMRLSYANVYIAVNLGTETNPGNAVNLAVAIEINGVTQQVTFTGYAQQTNQNPVTICGIPGCISMANGAYDVVSDGIYPWQFGLMSFPAGMAFFIREMRLIAPGAVNGSYVRHGSTGETGEGSFYCDPYTVPASQLLGTGAMAQQTGGISTPCTQGPAAIIGRAIGTPDIAVLLIGDSITDGTGDTSLNFPAGSGNGDAGYCMRALYGLNGRNVPVIKITVSGSSIYNVATTHAARRAYWKYATHAMVNYGRNDGVGVGEAAQTAAQVMNNLNIIYNSLKSGDSNIRHIASALIINSCTTTDSGATTANQTPYSGFANGGAFRQPLNTLIENAALSAPNPLDEYIDITGPCADATLTDRWPAGVSTDGVHPYGNTVQSALAAIVASHVSAWV